MAPPVQPKMPLRPAPALEIDYPLASACVSVYLSTAAGSGTIIEVDRDHGRALILTCKHVVEGSDGKVRVKLPWGKAEVFGEVLASDKTEADLATIIIPADANTPFVPIAKSRPATGEAFRQVGYPNMIGPTWRSGYVEKWVGNTEWWLSAIVDSGDSGSGAFLEKERALFAVISKKRMPSKNAATMIAEFCSNSGPPGPAVAVDLASIQRFVQACQPRFRNWQSKPGPSQNQPPGIPGPIPPPDAAPRVDPPKQPSLDAFAEIEKAKREIQAEIADLRAKRGADVQGVKDLESKLTAWVKQLLDVKAAQDAGSKDTGVQLGLLSQGLAELRNFAAAIDGKAGQAAASADDAQSRLPKLADALKSGEAKAGDVLGKVSDVESKYGWALSLALSALGLGGIYPAVKAGGAIAGVLSNRIKNRASAAQPAKIDLQFILDELSKLRSTQPTTGTEAIGAAPPASAASSMPTAPSADGAAQTIVARVLPQFVTKEVTDPWADSLIEALTKVHTQGLKLTPPEVINLAEEIYAGKTGKVKKNG